VTSGPTGQGAIAECQNQKRYGSVTLDGAFGTWSEHDEAVGAAWAAPGATRVEDRISVVY
jgi:osmotically-inducible protein OsmY